MGHVYSWASKTHHPPRHQYSINKDPEATEDAGTCPTESRGAIEDGDDNDLNTHHPGLRTDDREDDDRESMRDDESDRSVNSIDEENAVALGDVVMDPLVAEEQDIYE